MRVLILGSGGREHALAWQLSKSADVHCAPGNPGTAKVSTNHTINLGDHLQLVELANRLRPDLIIIGPEDPLITGVADVLRTAGFDGPGKAGASLEGSKAYSKTLMAKAGVPTARFRNFTDPQQAQEFARTLFATGNGAVVKASGAALGKGVMVTDSVEEAIEAIRWMLSGGLGESGKEIVVEERLLGREFSLLTICSGMSFVSLPVAQDHKRVGEGDVGANTGGMGTFAPADWVSPDTVRQTHERVVAPMLQRLNQDGIDYRGVLFSGLLVQDGIPYCLEYNVRFGDPETQSIMRLVKSGLLECLTSAARGEEVPKVSLSDDSAVTVIAASAGYPGEVKKDFPISLPSDSGNVVVFHSGTRESHAGLQTAGGRVLGVSATGPTVAAARDEAYEFLKHVSFEGMFYRHDIAR
ncbi:MAG TPA: phosphoribosylamine--glycine ligase [Fimbriimonadaceae bacterium]|nr:phosphoribosylamine--glycine ligase [Fimbriimonadaceae bacterium]